MMSNQTENTQREFDMFSQCAAAGILWVWLREGAIQWPDKSAKASCWRAEFFGRSSTIRRLLSERTETWATCEESAIEEILPGVWAVLSIEGDRRCEERGVALLVTSELVSHPCFELLCLESQLDVMEVRDRIAVETPLVPAGGVPALSNLIRQMHAAEFALGREYETADSVDRRLSESYEEIHLLHSLISGLVVGTEPDVFLGSAATELAEVCGFRWTAVLVDETTEAFAPDHVVVGRDHPSRAELRRLARTGRSDQQLASTCEVDGHGEIITCPIHIEDRRLGTLLAGGREHGDTSSVELKLLAAAAGHIGIFLANASLYADLDAMFISTLQAMVAAIDAKDPYTRGHSQRVALLSRDLAAALGMPDDFVKKIHLAGLVHDLGKIGVPESVLCKAGGLTEEERGRIRQHPQIGYRILKDIPQVRDLLPAVLCHHEAWDGTGYPARIGGEEIPIMARIVAIADSFDAMSSSRTYRSALPREKVFAELERCAGTQFDPGLVPTFLGLDLREYDRRLMRDCMAASNDPAQVQGEAA
ncbi:MAG: HD-GYP domain-containing protein [Phycisphaerales bacterium]|nr:HD-GYP domain-containing protein [Phycisphaerales bacterium]